MIFFPVLRTKRLTVKFKELTVGQSISLAKMPSHLREAECTAFLRMAVESVEQGPKDPSDWTVQERIFAVCHYIAATRQGEPDFSVGESGRFSDYFDGSKDLYNRTVFENPQFLIESGKDRWHLRPLTGKMSESVERLLGEVKFQNGEVIPAKLHWLLGLMSAQMTMPEVDKGELQTEAELDEFLLKRMTVFLAYPESEFMKLVAAYLAGRENFAQFFDISTNEEGIVCLPKEKEAGGNDLILPPAQFPSSACLSEFAREMGR